MRENTGKVVLVGAGPGDTGLLTLKGEKYIKQADCLVYDRLSSPEFLSMAKAGCELILCGQGKSQPCHEAGCHKRAFVREIKIS